MNSRPMQIALLGLVTVALLLVAFALRPGRVGAWGSGRGLHDDMLAAARAADNEAGGSLRASPDDVDTRPDADIAQILDAARESLRRNNLEGAKLLLDTAQSVHPHDPQVLSLQRDLQARENLASEAAAASAPASPHPRTTKRTDGAWHHYVHGGKKAKPGEETEETSGSTNGQTAATMPASTAVGKAIPANAGAVTPVEPTAPGGADNAAAKDVSAAKPDVVTPATSNGGSNSASPAASPAAAPSAAPAAIAQPVAPPVAPAVQAVAPATGSPSPATTPMPTGPAAPDNHATQSQPQSAAPLPAANPRHVTATAAHPASGVAPTNATQAPRTRAEINAELDSARVNGGLPKFGNPDPAGPGGAPSYTAAQHPN